MTAVAKVGDAEAGVHAPMFISLGLVAIFGALGGIYWDVTWHAVVGRESFWIPPHLFVYSGVGALLFAALGGSRWPGGARARCASHSRVGSGRASPLPRSARPCRSPRRRSTTCGTGPTGWT